MPEAPAPDSSSGTSNRPVEPRVFPTTGFAIISNTSKLDEENWPWYTPESFYPVNIGEVLCSRYQVLYKIGFGTTSTVWICRDLFHDKYVCMKAMAQDYPSASRELEAYDHLSEKAKADSPNGVEFVRQTLDHFQLHHGEYDYHFLIHEPLGVTLQVVLDILHGKYPMGWMARLALDFLRGLEFIHSANVVHGDITARNILFTIGNERVLKDWEEEEITNPSPRKLDGERGIFAKKKLTGLVTDWVGRESKPVLCDFGEARSGKECYGETIQPAPYRAPEVFLRITWGAPVDIWNLGCMLWHCATGQQLFPRSDDEEDEDEADGVQLATMVALLGPIPMDVLENSGQRGLEFFNEDGSPKYDVPHQTLESRFASAFEGYPKPPSAEQSKAFIGFIKRVLMWDDEDRPSASELLQDPWIIEKHKQSDALQL